MERKIEVLETVSKVEFCRVAKISRPTLYRYLSGCEVTPIVEIAIARAISILEQRQQPTPAA